MTELNYIPHLIAMLPDDKCADVLERSAIMEFCAGIPREEADRLAWNEFAGLREVTLSLLGGEA